MSNIEWTDETWNPVTGCNKVSPGCANCCAEGIANRFWGDRKFTDVQFHSDRLAQPLRWRKPRMVFVNSMSDLFHEAVTDEQLDQIFAVMALTPQHTYQVLTKRPQRMMEYFQGRAEKRVFKQACGIAEDRPSLKSIPHVWPLPNVWLGVTCENQRTADERIPLLLRIPAAVRFLSCEPLLGEIDLDLENVAVSFIEKQMAVFGGWDEARYGYWEDFGANQLLHWVIVGGESGPKARPCDIDRIRSIVRQCADAGVPCFVKQLGTHPTIGMDDGQPVFYSRSTGKGNNPAEWPANLRVRQSPQAFHVEGQVMHSKECDS